jgi:hypothetical protein
MTDSVSAFCTRVDKSASALVTPAAPRASARCTVITVVCNAVRASVIGPPVASRYQVASATQSTQHTGRSRLLPATQLTDAPRRTGVHCPATQRRSPLLHGLRGLPQRLGTDGSARCAGCWRHRLLVVVMVLGANNPIAPLKTFTQHPNPTLPQRSRLQLPPCTDLVPP